MNLKRNNLEKIYQQQVYFQYLLLKHKIKNIQKVSGFLGPEGKPVPVSENEVKNKIPKPTSVEKHNTYLGVGNPYPKLMPMNRK